MGIRIVQSSDGHTGSTLLVNLIHGLLCPDLPVTYGDEIPKLYSLIDDKLVIKTHNIDLDGMIENSDHELYFIMSERVDHKVNFTVREPHRSYKNVLIIDYSEILETPQWTIDDIVKSLHFKLIEFLPKSIIPDSDGMCQMKKRLVSMNKVCEEIKDKPFEYFDPFYHIHGSHRGRTGVVKSGIVKTHWIYR